MLLLWLACTDSGGKDSVPVVTAPVLSHTPPVSAQEGVAVVLDVGATDPEAIATVKVHYRTTGAPWWAEASLTPGEADAWSIEIPDDEVDAPSLEYWFEATDGGAVPAEAMLPEAGEAAPFVLTVGVPGLPLPFEEDFELADGEVALSNLGWGSAALAYQGAPWTMSAAQAHSGSTAAYHARGWDDGDLMTDWLISPPLDLSTASSLAVTWYEYGSTTENGKHGLYISTTSPDPNDGGYTPVVEALPAAPEDQWGRAQFIDLSAYAGQPVAWLAWYYEGQQADDWWIDDVYVGELKADLALVDLIVTPSPIRPGDTGELLVTLSNLTAVAGESLVVSVDFPEGGASASPSPQDAGPLAANGAAQLSFDLTIDPTTPEPSYLPVIITADLDGFTFTFEEQLLVGYASVAHVTWQPLVDGSVSMKLGVGDPESPTWEELIYADISTAQVDVELDIDITAQQALLPPATGDLRWYLVIESVETGILDSFSIEHLGVLYQGAENDPTYSGQPATFYLPEKPEFSLLNTNTSPSTLEPGTSSVGLSAQVQNSGAETQGPLVATLVSNDPDLIVVEGGPVTVREGLVSAGETVEIDGLFVVDIAPTHTDSTPLDAELQLTDGFDAWTLPISLEVPWPVLKITAVTIDDDGRDGRLDPGEAGEITLEVTNVGDLNCSGTVSGTLSLESTSTATGAVATNTETFSTLYVGTTRSSSDPWEMVIDASAVAGQELDLLLTLTDSAHTYEARTTINVSEPPWTSMSSTDDPIGDHGTGGFDFVNGQYRVMGDTLQMRLISDIVYDPALLFIEAWGLSTGADWTYYRLVLQSGVGEFQGYGSSGFVNIGLMDVSYPDAYTVQLDLPISSLGLFYDTLSLGFGSTWCGPPDYYCDQFPDGWGYPYDSFSTAGWYSLTW